MHIANVQLVYRSLFSETGKKYQSTKIPNCKELWTRNSVKVCLQRLVDRLELQWGRDAGTLPVQSQVLLGHRQSPSETLLSSAGDLTSLWRFGKFFGICKQNYISTSQKVEEAIRQHVRPIAEIPLRLWGTPTLHTHQCPGKESPASLWHTYLTHSPMHWKRFPCVSVVHLP